MMPQPFPVFEGKPSLSLRDLSKVASVLQFLQRCFCSCAVSCNAVMDLGHALHLSYISIKCMLHYPCPLSTESSVKHVLNGIRIWEETQIRTSLFQYCIVSV